MLNQEALEKVERVEAELARIDAEIRALKERHDEVLASDAEYAEYVGAHHVYHDGNPLSIRQYYEAMAELDALNAKLIGLNLDEFEQVWTENFARIFELENLLCA